MVPGRFQLVMEMIVDAFDGLTRETLGAERGRKYLPLVGSLFLFIWVSNLVALIPIPGFEEPTKDLHITLGLAIFVAVVVHASAIRCNGPWKYVLEYFEPMIKIKGVKIPNLFMFFLNVVGEIGKVISHGFRLFGNIFGGAIIMLVFASLIKSIVLPIGLQAFFGLFVGTVQAFVFAMLALTYIAVMIAGEEEEAKE